jgi:hypothetical protein
MKKLIINEWWLLAFVPASFFLMIIEFSLRIKRALTEFGSA